MGWASRKLLDFGIMDEKKIEEYEQLKKFSNSFRQIEILNKLIEHKGSVKDTAEDLGINTANVYRAIQRAERNALKRGWSPDHNLETSVPQGYMMERYTLQVNSKGETERLWVKGKQDTVQLEDSIRAFVDGLSLDIPKFKSISYPEKFYQDLCTNIIIGDAHLGLLAWEPETGTEGYDSDKCLSDLMAAADYLIETSPPTARGRVINVGDLMHCNDPRFVTPSHHNPLDHDGRFPRIIRKASVLMRFIIDRALTKFETVEVVNARGNHDPDAALWINLVLETAYEGEDRVTVVPNEPHLIPLTWGKCFTPVCHGDKAQFQRRYNMLTNVYYKEIGESNHVYCWQGHLHHKKREEIGRCTFEIFNTLTAPDQYHADGGYGAERNMTSIVLHKEFGEVDRKVCSLNLARQFQGSDS